MGLTRRDVWVRSVPESERRAMLRGPGGLLSQLEDPRPQVRRWAVRDLSCFAEAVRPLLACLHREIDEGVRESIFTALLAQQGDKVANGLATLLKSDDPGLRNGAADVLTAMAEQALTVIPVLLKDGDPLVRLYGVTILRHLGPPRAAQWLAPLLDTETDDNVRLAMIDGLSEPEDHHGQADFSLPWPAGENINFHHLTNGLLDEIMGRKPPGDGLRLWLMPCPSPVEPFLLAIHLLEHWPLAAPTDFNLLVGDNNPERLAMAQQGLFAGDAFRHLPDDQRQRHLTPGESGAWQASPALRENILFAPVDVTDRVQTKAYRGLDVIICQDLLGHYPVLTRRQVAGFLFDALNPGGFLLLGAGESLSRVSAMFTVRRFPDGIVYQKPTRYGA